MNASQRLRQERRNQALAVCCSWNGEVRALPTQPRLHLRDQEMAAILTHAQALRLCRMATARLSANLNKGAVNVIRLDDKSGTALSFPSR